MIRQRRDRGAEREVLARRSLREAAGLDHVRRHDGRHTALTHLAEKEQPDWVIQAQMGHVSPAMMQTDSHIRRKALDEAAAALEPSFKVTFPRHKVKRPAPRETCDRLTYTVHVTVGRSEEGDPRKR